MTKLSATLEGVVDALKKNRADDSAWTTLYVNLWPYAYAIAFRILSGNRSASEDVCQSAFLRALNYIDFDKLSGSDELLRYFSRMIHNSAIDFLNSRKEVTYGKASSEHYDLHLGESRLTDVPDADFAFVPNSDFSTLRQLEARESLLKLADHLTSRERQLASLVGLGYSLEEVAATLGISYSNAGVQIHRLRTKIQKSLIENDKKK